MADKAKMKEELRQELRSLLIAAGKRGMSVRELMRDFTMFMDRPLPFRELGYNTPEDLFRDMPDVVMIHWEQGQLMLVGVADEKTAHIAKLVWRQKDPPKKGAGARRGRPLFRSHSSYSRFQPPIPTVPAIIRGQIRDLVIAYPNGLLGSNFDIAFARRFGGSLLHKKLGFETRLRLLESMSDIVAIEFIEGGGYKIRRKELPRVRMNTREHPFDNKRPLPFRERNERVLDERGDFNDPRISKQSSLPPRFRQKPPNRDNYSGGSDERAMNERGNHGDPRLPKPLLTTPHCRYTLSLNEDDSQESDWSYDMGDRDREPPMASEPNPNSFQSKPPPERAPVGESTTRSWCREWVEDRLSPRSSQGEQQGDGFTTKDAGHKSDPAPQQPKPDERPSHGWVPRDISRGGDSAPERLPLTDLPTNKWVKRDRSDRESWDDKDTEGQGHSKQRRRSTSDLVDDEDDTGISLELKHSIRKVLEQKPDGVWASKFATEFKKVIGKEFRPKDLGHQSVIEMMSVLEDIVTIERPNHSGDWLLFDSRKRSGHLPARAADTSSSVEEHPDTRTAPPLDDTFKETMRQVLQCFPNGVVLGELPVKFKELSGQDLIPQKYGYATLDVLMLQLTNVVQMKYEGHACVKLYAVGGSSPQRNLLVHKPDQSGERLPADVVGPGVCYKPQPLPYDKVGDYIEVLVSYVVNPGHICLHLKGRDTTVSLDLLMDDLELVYDGREGDEYNMPDSLVTIGQICAALFPEDNNWHRVSITGIRDLDFVEVYYVDYGNTCCVSKKQLRLLKSRFLKLPAQAIRGRLANIKPVYKNEWTKASRDRLLTLCTDRPLCAYLTNMEQDMMSVALCDTKGLVDLWINDTLIQEHHAIFNPDCSTQVVEETEEQEERAAADNATELDTVASDGGGDAGTSLPVCQPVDQNLQERHVRLLDTVASDGGGDAGTSLPVCQAVDQNLQERHVRLLQLTDQHSLCIIRYEGRPYIISAELSALLWEKDLLRSMLRQKKLNLPKMVLPREEHPEIFEELMQYGVKGVIDKGGPKSHATLYELNNAVKVLEVFGHPSKELIMAIQLLSDKFDPEDPYWLGYPEEAEEVLEGASSDSGSHYELTLQELQIALEALNYKRKKTLQAMQQDVDPSRFVDDLDHVENQLREVKERIEDLSRREEANQQSCSVPEGTSTQSDNEPEVSKIAAVGKLEGQAQKLTTLFDDRDRKAPLTNPVAPFPSADRAPSSSRITSTVTNASHLPLNTSNPLLDPNWINQPEVNNLLASLTLSSSQSAQLTPSLSQPSLQTAEQQELLRYQQSLINQLAQIQALMPAGQTPVMPFLTPPQHATHPPLLSTARLTTFNYASPFINATPADSQILSQITGQGRGIHPPTTDQHPTHRTSDRRL